MAHVRSRHIIKKMQEILTFSPIVGIIGHRQVGKTTLMESVVKNYLTFDDEDLLIEAQKSAKSFLAKYSESRLGIDECQLCEKIFPALKERVRKNKQPGQYLLSGSVRFTAKKSIKESLTGRIVTLELLPLLLSELHSKALPKFWQNALSSQKIDENLLSTIDTSVTSSQVAKYFETGGLPGVCFIRSQSARSQRLSSYLETILDRDIRQIVPTTLAFPQLLGLLRTISKLQGVPLNLSAIAKETGISTPTIKKLLFAFEAVFLIKSVPLAGDYGDVVYYFEDMCEHGHLYQGTQNELSLMTHFLFNHIRGEFAYTQNKHEIRMFQYRTRAGVIVPIVIESNGQVLGVIPTQDEKPSRQEIAGGDSLLKRYSQSKIIFVNGSAKSKVIDERRFIARLSATC